MKEKRTIIIRNALLRELRNNLRKIILKAVGEVHLRYIKSKGKILRDIEDKLYYRPKEKLEKNKASILEKALRNDMEKSICYCDICKSSEKDMTYNPHTKGWFCIDCYKDLPQNLKTDWKPRYPLSKEQIREFFKRLSDSKDRSGANYRYSRQILKEMGISQKDQVKFINICKEYGGYNDVEILMNAQEEIYSDLDMDIK